MSLRTVQLRYPDRLVENRTTLVEVTLADTALAGKAELRMASDAVPAPDGQGELAPAFEETRRVNRGVALEGKVSFYLPLPAGRRIRLELSQPDGFYRHRLWSGEHIVHVEAKSGDVTQNFYNTVGDVSGEAAAVSGGDLRVGDVHLYPAAPGGFTEETLELYPVGIRLESFESSAGISLLRIPEGEFSQGSPSGEEGRNPSCESSRSVRITRPFWAGSTPVTEAQWTAVMGGEPPAHPGAAARKISWLKAVEFCRRLTERDRELNRIDASMHYRLPTEAEWEYFCRAGEPAPRYRPLEEIALTRPFGEVGQLTPNAWGIYDCIGGVYEWCRDAWQQTYPGGHHEDPFYRGGDNDMRVFRGGCFQDDPAYLRAAARLKYRPDHESGRIGFRVVAVPEPEEAGEVEG